MRTVMMKTWEYDEKTKKSGWSEDYTLTGRFHQWVVLSDYLYAIIEGADGTICRYEENNIIFIN